MASTYSPNLRLELIGTGEQQGTWGSTTNTNLGTLLEEAIGGYASVTVSDIGDTTLTTNNGSADQSRNMVINLTGTISANRNVICPAIEKLYVVKNATTGGFSVTFKVTGQTGVTIPNGQTYFLYVNGIDANLIVGNVASTNATNTFTENQIISVTDNTDAALRITQLGTGNAILVEDSTNPDSTPFVVDATGYVLSGAATSVPLSSGSPGRFQATALVGFQSLYDGANSNPAIFEFAKNRSGAIVNSGDVAGQIRFSAFDGTNYLRLADIYASVGGTPGTNDMPGDLVFSTTADGASSPTERMRINNRGNVNIGTAANPESVLQITGATTPTGLMIGSISGTTLTVTSVGGGTISVGDRLISGTSIDYNTYITAFGTGTGLTGTYTINNPTTLGSSTIYFLPSNYNTIGFVDTNTSTGDSTPFGGIEWYSSDATSPGAGVKAYVAAITESISPDSALIFGTADTAQAVERMRINSFGYVGIGKKTVTTPLDMEGQFRSTSGSVDFRINPLSGSNATIIGNASNSDLVFYANNLEKARLSAAGNFGIGESSPSAKLDVSGNIRTSSSVPEVIYNETDTGTLIRTLVDGGRWDIRKSDYTTLFGVDNATGDTILCPSVGNVGIGASASATSRLYVNGSAQAATFEVGNASDTTISRASAGVIAVEGGVVPKENRTNTFTAQQNITLSGIAPIGLYIAASSDPTSDRASIITGNWEFGQDSNGNGTDDFFIYDGSAARTRLYISTTGDVGIGKISPACSLDVNGGIKTTSANVTSPAATDGNIFGGTYTPSLTAITNVAATTAYQCQYIRVGNVVTVSGRVEIDATTNSVSTVMDMSLPIASEFNSVGQAAGTFASAEVANGSSGQIGSNATTDRARFEIIVSTAAARTYWFSFTYLIR